ncbi:DUF4288 domain-containing protein [Micromonospora auratinigra]|uniref:Uncharacterized protein n=1 Tax=Micromonospora auratinigra TaxID=261654 RepID=A0A1A9AAP8_9ACTN|nr:DUF4288 domain-containing protein [Micromonospora auratinigra]SBT53562.1 protein of unknown function (DUF4288) [Micromonospora auratinigra]
MSRDDEVWFSASMKFALYTQDGKFFQHSVSVYLFRAPDHDVARLRALQIGAGQEQIYLNAEGSLIRIALVQVDTLDMIGEIEDGVEVYSWPGPEENQSPFPWSHKFNPGESDFYPSV